MHNIKLFSTFANVINNVMINKITESNIYQLVLALGIPDSFSTYLAVAKFLPVENFRKHVHFIK